MRWEKYGQELNATQIKATYTVLNTSLVQILNHSYQSFSLNHLIENVLVPSWSVGFYDVLYGSPTDRTARIDLSLEPQSTVITQTHVSTRIDDGVHLLIEAHCALTALAAQGCVRCRKSRWDRWTERRAGSRHWKITHETAL